MKTTLFYLNLFLLMILPIQTQAKKFLVLSVGENQKISVPAGSTIRVSNSKTVRVQDQGRHLLLSGRKVGQTVVSHAHGALRVQVVSPAVAKTFTQFEKALATMQGLELDVVDNKIVVQGELLRLSDWQKLSALQSSSNGTWQMKAHIDPSLESQVRHFLQTLLRPYPAGTYRLRLEPYPQIEVAKTSIEQMNREPRLLHCGIVIVANQGLTDLQPAIRLKLTLAEVQKGASEKLGLNFEDGQTVQLLPRFKAPQDFIAALGFLTSKGLAQLLATPSLTARSGHEAEFLAGGEFAVRSSHHRVKEVSWKRHGLWLKFKPTLDPRGIVQLVVNTEFSAPDYASAVDGIPSLRTSKASSAVDVRLGATVLLSGLVQMSQGFMASGPAGLASIPILGRLFRSEDFNTSRSELLIFVTPELVPIETDEDLVLPQEESAWKSID